MMVPRGGTAIGIEVTEVRVGGGDIAIAIGATIGYGAAAVMIVTEEITVGATTEMIAANIAAAGADV